MNEEIKLEELAPWVALTLTLAGGFLRILYLAKNGLWLDEAFSVWLANQNLADMLGWMLKIDQHPPLYYLLLHAWVAHYGDTPYYVRMLSVLFGIATIPIIYLTGKRLSDPLMGLAGAALLAFSPFNLYYAQEARMYTLLTFNASVGIYALVRLLTDPRASQPIGGQLREYMHVWRSAGPPPPDPEAGFRYQVEPPKGGLRLWIYRHRWSPIQTVETDLAWLAFILFSLATLYTHNTAVFFFAAVNIFVIGQLLYKRLQRSPSSPTLHAPSLANWLKAQLAILLLWSPWLVVFVRQASRLDQQFWIPKPTWESIAQVLTSLIYTSAPSEARWGLILWILGGLLILGLVYYRKKLSIFVLLAALFAVPFLGELLVSLRQPIFLDRTLIWLTIPLLLLLAAGIMQLRFRALIVILLGTLLTSYLFTSADYYRWYQKEDWRSAAGFLAYFAEQDDLVLFNSNFVVIPFDYYFRNWEEEYRLEVNKQGVPRDLFESGIPEPIMTADDIPTLLSLIYDQDRVWLVYSHNDYTDPQGLIPQTLAEKMTLTRTRNFYGGMVQLYTR